MTDQVHLSHGKIATQEHPISEFVIEDGGRAHTGFTTTNDAGDCVVRALAIASGLPYADVYESVAALSAEMGGRRTARDGVHRKVYSRWLSERGWVWTPTMHIGQGCTVHLRAEELPEGRLIVRLSKHLCAVLDGVVHDTADPRRNGTRCVYGYWRPGDPGALDGRVEVVNREGTEPR